MIEQIKNFFSNAFFAFSSQWNSNSLSITLTDSTIEKLKPKYWISEVGDWAFVVIGLLFVAGALVLFGFGIWDLIRSAIGKNKKRNAEEDNTTDALDMAHKNSKLFANRAKLGLQKIALSIGLAIVGTVFIGIFHNVFDTMTNFTNDKK